MIYLNNTNTDPALNHAIEEYFLMQTQDEVFMLWQNVPTALLGKHQDAYAELDLDYTKEKGIQVVRRLSGGGTVFCDLQNMQYSFITDAVEEDGENAFSRFAAPVVDALKNLGLAAEFTGRNDIVINGKKVSGNAQYRYRNRILHHGTLLFDVNREMLAGALRSRPIKFEKKAVKSVSSRIGTIKDWLPEMTVTQFMTYLKEHIVKWYDISEVLEPDADLMDRVKPYLGRFQDPNWNMGIQSREMTGYSVKYPFGLVDYKLRLKDNRIEELIIGGDFFSEGEPAELARQLVGCELKADSLRPLLTQVGVGELIKGMQPEDLLEDLICMGRG